MDQPLRHAIYWVPDPGPLADAGAAWLGWDVLTGQEPPAPDMAPLPRPRAEITEDPRRYGLHATLKPPFRLAPGTDAAGLAAALDGLAATLAPVTVPRLALTQVGRFLALTAPEGAARLAELAARVVADLDSFRAPAPPEETARRRAAGLSPRQEALLVRWGYPYVMEEFRFHITLTGKLPGPEAEIVRDHLARTIAPLCPAPFRLASLALCGEGADGRFRLISRHALTGREQGP